MCIFLAQSFCVSTATWWCPYQCLKAMSHPTIKKPRYWVSFLIISFSLFLYISHICTYILHTYTHTYMRACMNDLYIHTYVRTYIHTYIPTYMLTYIHIWKLYFTSLSLRDVKKLESKCRRGTALPPPARGGSRAGKIALLGTSLPSFVTLCICMNMYNIYIVFV